MARKTVGRSPYGERGLKSRRHDCGTAGRGRSPYGERGLKYPIANPITVTPRSLSLRRAWIEIREVRSQSQRFQRRSPYGERGLKFSLFWRERHGRGRSPYGERGLKYGCVRGGGAARRVALLTESVD